MIDNFIGVFDNVLSKEHCEELIKVYEDCQALNYCINRQNLGQKKINQDTNLVFPSSKEHIKDVVLRQKRSKTRRVPCHKRVSMLQHRRSACPSKAVSFES